MTSEQRRQVKLLCYVHWILSKRFEVDSGVRDLYTLEEVVTMPGGGSLTCFSGAKLTNRKDLFAQIGWFVYYMLEGEPFNSKNKALTALMVIWCLENYKLEFDKEKVIEFINTVDTMRSGNSDISSWFANQCK
ncbi:MAG: hypothetical protein JXQ65_12775 [Candidatus Marinimicrobia bacterium]|nr:hypothetical protein [Candidatus Neomarinimicrobiota bacterium]